MCVNSTCSELLSRLPPQLLPLSCTFLFLSLHRWGAFFLCVWISRCLSWVCECMLLLLSVFPLLFLCLFVLILVSLCLFLPVSVCVCLFFPACLFLSFSVCLLSLLPTPYILLSLSPRLSRPHLLPSCLPTAPCAWPAPTAAGSGERVRSDCPGGHLMD